MKKNRYRIQIETKRNGKKQYQAHLDISRGLFKWSRWTEIINKKVNYNWWYFDTITDAEEAIQDHIKESNKDYENEIINVEYKYL